MKLFVTEPGSDAVAEAVSRSEWNATSAISHVEINAAIARLVRENHIDITTKDALRASIDELFADLVVLDVTPEVLAVAARLVHTHPLRTNDAVHLASAYEILLGHEEDMTFACWDRRLWDVASAVNFLMLPTDHP